MRLKYTQIKINDQKYLFDIINKYPEVCSGRKNYPDHYKRVLKNILLSKAYQKINYKNIFEYNFQNILINNKSIILRFYKR